MRVLIVAAFVLTLCSACASLKWQPEDSTSTRIGKTSARVLMGIPTLGYSELILNHNADELAKDQAAARRRRYLAELRTELQRYRTMAETAETEEERETALRLADGVLRELQVMFGETSSPAPQTCVMVPVGGVLVQRCQ